MPDATRPSVANEQLHVLSRWIDAGNGHRDPEAVTWGRLSKVSEECGEVIAAYIGATGQNPRKGVTCTNAEVEDELLDVAITALGAVAHLHGNDGTDVLAQLEAKIQRVVVRALGIAQSDPACPRCANVTGHPAIVCGSCGRHLEPEADA